MRKLIETLYAAQPVLLRSPANPRERQTTLDNLQKTVPAQVLAHYLRMIGQGRKGATLVSNGVCSGCHLRVAAGTVHVLANPTDLYLCENCGAYLMLAPEEMPEAKARVAPVVTAVRKPRKARALAAA
jgi:hypothetical protein